MGSNQSVQVVDEDEEEEEEESGRRGPEVKKVLEQEPEMLPCYASASPLSPQLSSLGTPRLGPSIRVWDPYNVLAPPPPLPPPPSFSRSYSSDVLFEDDRIVTEAYLISHGECEVSLRPELVNGRCPDAALTANGKRQARALAVFLNSQGVRFNAVYTSPLDRARATAVSVCQEINFAEEHIRSIDALTEMSQGHWESCLRSEIYTQEMLCLMDRLQPDFSAPSGESLREVEFRMAQFLNGTILSLPEKLKSEFLSPQQTESQGFPQHNSHENESQGSSQHNSHAFSNSVHDRDGPSYQPAPHWDLLHRNRQLSRKKSGKSRLQVVTTTGDNYPDEELSPQGSSRPNGGHDEVNVRNSSSVSSCIGVFTHSIPIKCLLTALLGCSPIMSHKFCVEDSSVTVLQHSWRTGWQIKRLNDASHLRLL